MVPLDIGSKRFDVSSIPTKKETLISPPIGLLAVHKLLAFRHAMLSCVIRAVLISMAVT